MSDLTIPVAVLAVVPGPSEIPLEAMAVAPPSPRRVALEKGARDLGGVWVTRTHAQLVQEGRRMRGGFPGTIREARGLASDLSTTLTAALTMDESAWVTKAIYAEAKRVWRIGS